MKKPAPEKLVARELKLVAKREKKIAFNTALALIIYGLIGIALIVGFIAGWLARGIHGV
jgi:uncharacterized membrane protein YciS (DUF1049 family)